MDLKENDLIKIVDFKKAALPTIPSYNIHVWQFFLGSLVPSDFFSSFCLTKFFSLTCLQLSGSGLLTQKLILNRFPELLNCILKWRNYISLFISFLQQMTFVDIKLCLPFHRVILGLMIRDGSGVCFHACDWSYVCHKSD